MTVHTMRWKRCAECPDFIKARSTDLCWKCRARHSKTALRCACGQKIMRETETECATCRKATAKRLRRSAAPRHVPQRSLLNHEPIESRLRWQMAVWL